MHAKTDKSGKYNVRVGSRNKIERFYDKNKSLRPLKRGRFQKRRSKTLLHLLLTFLSFGAWHLLRKYQPCFVPLGGFFIFWRGDTHSTKRRFVGEYH